MTPQGELSACERITALNVALRRPQSLRRAIARSAADAARLGQSASRVASRIAFKSYLVEDLRTSIVPLPPESALADAFSKSLTRDEQITQRIRACLALSREPKSRDVAAILRGDIAPSKLTVTNLAA